VEEYDLFLEEISATLKRIDERLARIEKTIEAGAHRAGDRPSR
jgi:hypothetical protein